MDIKETNAFIRSLELQLQGLKTSLKELDERGSFNGYALGKLHEAQLGCDDLTLIIQKMQTSNR